MADSHDEIRQKPKPPPQMPHLALQAEAEGGGKISNSICRVFSTKGKLKVCLESA